MTELTWNLEQAWQAEPPPDPDEKLEPIPIRASSGTYTKWGLTENLSWYTERGLDPPFTGTDGKIHGTPTTGSRCRKDNGRMCEGCRLARQAWTKWRRGSPATRPDAISTKLLSAPSVEPSRSIDGGRIEREVREWMIAGARDIKELDPAASRVITRQAPKTARAVRRCVETNEVLLAFFGKAAIGSPWIELAIAVAPIAAVLALTFGFVQEKHGFVFGACKTVAYKMGVTEEELIVEDDELPFVNEEPDSLWAGMAEQPDEEPSMNGERIAPNVH